MRLMPVLALAVGIAASSPHAAGATDLAAGAIRVEPGDWGQVHGRDIEAVLRVVADVMVRDFPAHSADRFIVEHDAEGPRTLFRNSKGDPYRILLNVQDARWDQFAYQFSHELCHVFSNFEQRKTTTDAVIRHYQWFEESLCEAVSLVTLEQVAARWEKAPPQAGWENYAPAFREYSKRLQSQGHRVPLSEQKLIRWFAEHEHGLESDPYARDKNEFVATSLVSLLEATPGSLKSLAYLNSRHAPRQASFAAYLEDWYDCCPENDRALARDVITLFRGRGPGAT